MNPIVQALSGKNNIMGQVQQINQLINGNPEAIYQQMIQTNHQFRDFVAANNGKSPEQIAQENGLDLNMLNQLR